MPTLHLEKNKNEYIYIISRSNYYFSEEIERLSMEIVIGYKSSNFIYNFIIKKFASSVTIL